jgi:predicted ATPase/class 3 adenylate cyclase
LSFCGACGSQLPSEPTVAADVQAPALPQPTSLEERKPVTVLFADIEASTELATRLDPEDLRGVLRPFFEAMLEEIERHGGSVEKFIGDAVVGIFGAPIAHEDDPERAIRAALGMQDRLRQLNATLAATAGGDLTMRIGVNTGEVLAASRSGEHEGMVTGEAVNLAARLQANAPSGSVVVGERTHRHTRHLFGFAQLPEASLKGFSRPIAAWRVAPEEVPAGRSPQASPLVGRSEELGLLKLVYRRTVADGRPNLITVLGAPGIGKSRLADEFAKQLRAEPRSEGAAPARILRGRCPPYGNGLTYWPLAEMLKTEAGILDTDSPTAVVAKARAHLASTLAEDPQAPGLGDVLLASIGVSTGTEPLSGTDSAVAQQTVLAAWRRYIETRAAAEPIVAIFEDIHWADASLLNLVEALAARLHGPVLFLCLARSDLVEHRPGWGAALPNSVRFGLSPLTAHESASLVSQLLDDAAPPDLLRLILDRSEGNPFFAGELIRMVTEDGTLERRDGNWELARTLPTSLPDTVQAVILSRIDLLSGIEKRALQDASVIGRVFWQGALARLGGHLPSTVDELIERGLVQEREASVIAEDRELIFSHGLTPEVAYRTIPRSRRAAAHAAVATWIEEMTQGRDEEFAELLAHHAEQAGDDARTARYAMLAGHRHRRVFAAEDAIAWYDRALAAAEQLAPGSASLLIGETALSRGDAREQLGQFAAARADYELALQVAREASGDRGWLEARALAAIVRVLRLEDRFDDSRRLMPAALELARSAGQPDVEVQLLYTDGTTAFALNQLEEARELHSRALHAADEIADIEGQALAHQGLAECGLYLGPLDEAHHHATLADGLLRRLGHRPMLHRNQHVWARILWMLGEVDDAAACAGMSAAGSDELGNRPGQASALSILALIALVRGDMSLARQNATQSVSVARAADASHAEVAAHISRALVAIELGDDEVASTAVTSASAAATPLAAGFFRPILTALDAVVQAQLGTIKAARVGFGEAFELSTGRLHHRAVCLWAEILTWERIGASDDLRDAGERLRATVGRTGRFGPWADYAVGRAALLTADHERATSALSDALARSQSDAQLTWRAHLTLSSALHATGREHEARDHEDRASELVRRMGQGLDRESMARFETRTTQLGARR